MQMSKKASKKEHNSAMTNLMEKKKNIDLLISYCHSKLAKNLGGIKKTAIIMMDQLSHISRKTRITFQDGEPVSLSS